MIARVRGWCNRVLPAVFDDSLSYMEMVCKLKDKVNEVIDEVNSEVTVEGLSITYREEDECLVFKKLKE